MPAVAVMGILGGVARPAVAVIDMRGVVMPVLAVMGIFGEGW